MEDRLSVVEVAVYATAQGMPHFITSSAEEVRTSPATEVLQVIQENTPMAVQRQGQTGRHWDVAVPVHLHGPLAGVVPLQVSLRQADQLAGRARRQAVLIMAAATVAIVLLMRVFLRHTLHRRLHHLVTTMARAEAGDLAAEARVDSADALGRVAESCNRLLRRIRNFNAELQETVAQATAELRDLNGKLFEARRQRGRLERRAAVGEVAAMVAHAVGTPFTSVAGHLQRLAEKDIPSSPPGTSPCPLLSPAFAIPPPHWCVRSAPGRSAASSRVGTHRSAQLLCCAEDAPGSQAVLAEAVSRRGYRVQGAPHGRWIASALRAGAFGVALVLLVKTEMPTTARRHRLVSEVVAVDQTAKTVTITPMVRGQPKEATFNVEEKAPPRWALSNPTIRSGSVTPRSKGGSSRNRSSRPPIRRASELLRGRQGTEVPKGVIAVRQHRGSRTKGQPEKGQPPPPPGPQAPSDDPSSPR